MSISPSDYIEIEPYIGNKRVVLVFDDLERCVLDEIQVLGCIFVMFMVFMLLFRDKKIVNDKKYAYLLSDEIIRGEYPEFYNRNYVLHSARKWIIDGEWEIESINNKITLFLEKKKATEPKEIIKNHELLTIGDEEMKHGFPEVVNCFSELENSRKRLFVGIFDKTWKHHTNSNEFLVKDSQIGFERLRELLQNEEKIEKQQ